MRRRLFFLLEKLKISRKERRAIFTLMIGLILLASANVVVRSSSPLKRKEYATLDRRFEARTALMKQKNRKLMARYDGRKAHTVAASDSSRDDTTRKKQRALKKSLVDTARINLNTADTKTLQKLSGIGRAYARRIIRYRQQHGAFTSRDELKKISGIGPKTFQAIKPHVTVGEHKEIKKPRKAKAAPLAYVAMPESTKNNRETPAKFMINVNTADAKALEKLTGIGSVYAGRIVAWRQQNGAFTSKDELLNIKGIGKKRLAKIKPFIKLTGSE